MQAKFSSISAILIIAVTLFMSQNTTAQRRSPKAKTAPTPVKTVETAVSTDKIFYTVSMSKPWTHLLEVEMRYESTQMPANAELKMPVWTPGSYLIREYAKNVQDFSAADANGKQLTWDKINKNTWQINTGGVKTIIAKYRVYANELTVRTNELNDEHAFFNNAALLMFPKDGLKTASTVKINPFGAWKIATGLPKVDGQPNTFRAESFDILYDSPFEIGNFKQVDFNVQGKPHRFIVEGDGNYDLAQIGRDTEKIVGEAYKIFGEFGYDNYTFILNTRGGGGLEHLNSTALQFDRFGFTTRYKSFLTLTAHEYFHNFNVKRIRPDALGPFDYENENYTKLLWVAEGGTAYYENVLVNRAGLITDKEFLAGVAAQIQSLQARPGRHETSLEDASFNAWIKFYRPDENAVNNQISYYDKGELVNFLLDWKIRRESNGAKSLDDVMQYLYTEFFKKGKNYAPADYQKISEMMAGKPLDDFFAKYVRGTAEIDYDEILKPFGLQLNIDASAEKKAYLGADFKEENGRLNVSAIPNDTPAYEQGLNTGDQIVAIDGYRASLAFLTSYLADKKPGDKIKITVFRFDKMREIDFTLGKNIRRTYDIKAVADPSGGQRKLYKDYFGTDLK